MVNLLEIVPPKFVFSKYRHFRFGIIQKLRYKPRGIKGEICHTIYFIVIVANFVTRRRKKSKENLFFRVIATQSLNDWTRLLKFAERSGMKPHVETIGCNRRATLLQAGQSVALAG